MEKVFSSLEPWTFLSVISDVLLDRDYRYLSIPLIPSSVFEHSVRKLLPGDDYLTSEFSILCLEIAVNSKCKLQTY
jgi:hypothetical protein